MTRAMGVGGAAGSTASPRTDSFTAATTSGLSVVAAAVAAAAADVAKRSVGSRSRLGLAAAARACSCQLQRLRAGSEGAGAREVCPTHTMATLVGAKARAKARGECEVVGRGREGGQEARRRCGGGRLLDECGRGVAGDAVLDLQPAALSDERRRGQQGRHVGVHAHVDAGAAWFGLGIHDMRRRVAARTVSASAPRGTKIVKVENKAPQPRLVGAAAKGCSC